MNTLPRDKMKLTDIGKAFEQGFNSLFVMSAPLMTCPYTIGTPLYSAYMRGYEQAYAEYNELRHKELLQTF